MRACTVAVEVRSDWYERLDAATETTIRAVSVAQQQAVKLFDIDASLIPRLVQGVSRMSERQVRDSSAAIRAQMRELGAGYPQILSIDIFSSSGELTVSSHSAMGPLAESFCVKGTAAARRCARATVS